MFFIINGLLLASALILISSLIRVKRLIQELPKGSIQAQWKSLSLLMLFFIAGYVVYAIIHWNDHTKIFDLVVPAVFFCGAVFVFIACSLSLKTASDINRIYHLERESITDPLMGIFNRRYLERRLHDEILRSRRYNLPLSIFLLDIDYFKKINDTHGHQVGDMVLKELAQVIVSSVRELDIITRYGGEEILVILPNTSEASAVILAERLRRTIEDSIMVMPDEKEGRQAIRITVSIGVAGFRQKTSGSRKLMEKADMALYRAKNEGRNRVILHADSDDQTV